MSAVEINLYNMLKKDFNLSDERAMLFVNSIEKVQEEAIKSPIEQLSLKIDLRFEQMNAKFDLKFEEMNAKFEIKFEQVYTKIEKTNNNTLKWFMGGFITIVLMVLGLYVGILLK